MSSADDYLRSKRRRPEPEPEPEGEAKPPSRGLVSQGPRAGGRPRPPQDLNALLRNMILDSPHRWRLAAALLARAERVRPIGRARLPPVISE
jgi:hypothetical protein